MIDHRAEISAIAQRYLEEVRAAAAAAHERLRAGILLEVQAPQDEAVPEAPTGPPAMPDIDPIFATREFDVPAEALAGLVDFDAPVTDAEGIPVWKD